MPTVVVLVAWAGVLVVARVWGKAILESGQVIRLGSPPVVGWDEWYVTWRVLGAATLAVAALVVAPAAAARLPWRRLLWAGFFAAAAWALALALTRGWAGVTFPLVLPGDEYLLDVPEVGSPGGFLRDFTSNIDQYVVHVRSHPPGMVLALWSLDRLGLGGTGPAAVLCIGGGAAVVPAVLVTARHLAGEVLARRAVPFVALAPAAIWVATSADALFAGVAAWSTVAVVLATARDDRRGDALAVAGGIGFGCAAMLGYALVLTALLPLVVAVSRRRLRPIVLAAIAGATVVGTFALFGFWWVEGLFRTRLEVEESVASTRPLRYFAVSNIAALGIVVGPATAVALARLRDRRLWLVLAAPIAAMVAMDVSGFAKGEVERIWLPFSLWLLASGAALGSGSPWSMRRWLALQLGFALVFQVAVRTRW